MKVKPMESERMINALMSHLAPVIREVQQQHGRTLHGEFEQRIAAVEIGFGSSRSCQSGRGCGAHAGGIAAGLSWH